jgi:hypothetical protein
VILGNAGESRARGYLYVLERSLRTFLPREVVADALREVESHIRERVAQVEPMPNERDALERVLAELGPPLKVAQAYAMEMTMEEAAATGRILAILRALFHLAATGALTFLAVLGLIVGYLAGASFISIAALKPIFPDNVGLWVREGEVSLGGKFPVPEDAVNYGGYWIIPICLVLGMLILVGTHRAARALVRRWRERRALAIDPIRSSRAGIAAGDRA